jgi:enediyne biosynthesis protein E5
MMHTTIAAITRRWDGERRLGGLRRFAFAITILNVLGHTVLGFEQAWVVPFAAVFSAYLTEIVLDLIDARLSRRAPHWCGGWQHAIDFLLSAHITGLAVGMLLYTNARIGAVVAAAVTAIASKSVLRVRIDGVSRHVFNPSNFGISVTLLAFPWVGIAPPYQFTENLDGWLDWLLPAVIVVTGSALNARFTRRLPLIAAWLAGFVLQAVARSSVAGVPASQAFVPMLVPMSGVAFLLYTFYMATDPATTPSAPRAQVLFGLALAAVYGMLVWLHIVFGLFFALTIVSALRAAALAWLSFSRHEVRVQSPSGLVALGS